MKMLSSEPEFPPKISPCPVSEFFSIDEFAVLTSNSPEPVHEESKLKLLLSSACIAVNNTNWYVQAVIAKKALYTELLYI